MLRFRAPMLSVACWALPYAAAEASDRKLVPGPSDACRLFIQADPALVAFVYRIIDRCWVFVIAGRASVLMVVLCAKSKTACGARVMRDSFEQDAAFPAYWDYSTFARSPVRGGCIIGIVVLWW